MEQKTTIGYAAIDQHEIATVYSFDLPDESTNDNQIYVIFNDDNRHDAEISMDRQFGNNWRKRYQLARVEIRTLPEAISIGSEPETND